MDYSCRRYLNFVTHSGCRIWHLSFVVFRVIAGCILEVNRFEHFAWFSKLMSLYVSSLLQKLHIEHCFTEYWDKNYTYHLSLIVSFILQRKRVLDVARKYKTRARAVPLPLGICTQSLFYSIYLDWVAILKCFMTGQVKDASSV